jgi:thiamine kinase-like enzyme
MESAQQTAFRQCQALFPAWQALSAEQFDFDAPKGFSSFTMGIRARVAAEPPAVSYRRLAGKENAILDFETERAVFLLLGAEGIAAHCHCYDETCRIEAFYDGRTLTAADLKDPAVLRKIADQLHRFHQLKPPNLPEQTFFELLHAKWGPQARFVVEDMVGVFPANEQEMCAELRDIYSTETLAKVLRCLPASEPVFCHNDTYHGNIMWLRSGDIKLLDFEFSCLNQRAFDFSNLFAETVMQHKLPDYPYFRVGDPPYSVRDIAVLVDAYLDNDVFNCAADRENALQRLVQETQDMIMLSDYMYAMAALPLALEPLQKIRFIPYAHARFGRFLAAYERRFA